MDTYIKRLGLKKTGMVAEKKMLEAIVDLAEKSGYRRTSICGPSRFTMKNI